GIIAAQSVANAHDYCAAHLFVFSHFLSFSSPAFSAKYEFLGRRQNDVVPSGQFLPVCQRQT
ncbi:MAG: hypothetical protein ACLFVA_06595, partial [Dehalococcoidia bacterium]